MKTKKIILFAIFYFLLGFCNCTNAQNSSVKKERYIERSINGQSYVYDALSCTIQNKKNQLDTKGDSFYCGYHVGLIKPYNAIFDEVFSTKRKKELKGMILPMLFYCDSSGNVLRIVFSVKDISMITLQEVNALENAFLKSKVEIRGTCSERKYYPVASVYRGWL